MSQQLRREAKLEFEAIRPDEFLRWVAEHGGSAEHPRGVKSQYEDQLLNQDKNVGALSMSACGQRVAALSYGCVPLRQPEGGVGGRIDVVAVAPHCRGLGIASLLLAETFQRFAAEHGPRLASFSVIAAHPAVARCVLHYGFEPLERSSTPLYSLSINADNREQFLRTAEREVRESMSELRKRCTVCQRWSWSESWCDPERNQ